MIVVDDDINLECEWIENGTYHQQQFQSYEIMLLSDWIISNLERHAK